MIDWFHFVMQATELTEVNQFDVFGLISTAGPVVKLTLLILLIMSVVSWAIIISKHFMLRKAMKRSEKFLNLYRSSGNFGSLYSSTKHLRGPIAELFRTGYSELLRIRKSGTGGVAHNPETKTNPEPVIAGDLGVVELVERALKREMSSEVSGLESSLTFLATTGTTAPFIGLFGTVWGIMTAFIGLASRPDVPTLHAVAPGIAEALIATAIGLAAAIPAVVAYNYFISRVKRIDVEMENFSSEFLNIVDRYLKKI
ncbi:protein TolQ [Desulfobacterota bacterium AH_259_B03_O07]|nr:protein TolQ [Desulfobacterota bacterium AH_259_B03_O07]